MRYFWAGIIGFAFAVLAGQGFVEAGAKEGKQRWQNNKDVTGKYKVHPAIKVAANSISRLGRLTQGVIVMGLKDGDSVAALSVEEIQDEAPNPNILSTAEAAAQLPLISDGSKDGSSDGSANGAKPAKQ